MKRHDLLSLIEEGLANGRIAPHLAAYIAAEVTGAEALDTGYDERIRLEEHRDDRTAAQRQRSFGRYV